MSVPMNWYGYSFFHCLSSLVAETYEKKCAFSRYIYLILCEVYVFSHIFYWINTKNVIPYTNAGIEGLFIFTTIWRTVTLQSVDASEPSTDFKQEIA